MAKFVQMYDYRGNPTSVSEDVVNDRLKKGYSLEAPKTGITTSNTGFATNNVSNLERDRAIASGGSYAYGDFSNIMKDVSSGKIDQNYIQNINNQYSQQYTPQEIEAAKNRLSQFEKQNQSNKPAFGMIDGRFVDINSSEWKNYENNLFSKESRDGEKTLSQPSASGQIVNGMKNTQPQTSATSTPTTSNVFDAQSQLLINQLKQKIAQARSEQEGIIKNSPQQFDPLRSQSELSKGQQLRSVLERNALMGDRGGIGRSAALQTQTAGENRLNTINLQQQNVIDTANQRIADLESQGRFEEANILAQQRIAELQDAMAQQRLMEQRAYNENLTAQENARLDQLRADEIARQDQLRQEEFAREDQMTTQEQERQDFQTSIMANYSDLSAYRDRLREQGAPQWQIDQVEAARLQKIMEQNLDPRTGQPLPVDTTPSLTSSSAALQLWEQLGVANEAVSRALGIPVGTRFTQSAARETGATGPSQAPVSELPPKQVIALAESSLRGTSGSASADRFVQLNEAGYFDNLTPSEIKTLMNKFGVTELMLEQAENRATIPTQGITLPSGRVIYPSGGNVNPSEITPTAGGFTGALNMIR